MVFMIIIIFPSFSLMLYFNILPSIYTISHSYLSYTFTYNLSNCLYLSFASGTNHLKSQVWQIEKISVWTVSDLFVFFFFVCLKHLTSLTEWTIPNSKVHDSMKEHRKYKVYKYSEKPELEYH